MTGALVVHLVQQRAAWVDGHQQLCQM